MPGAVSAPRHETAARRPAPLLRGAHEPPQTPRRSRPSAAGDDRRLRNDGRGPLRAGAGAPRLLEPAFSAVRLPRRHAGLVERGARQAGERIQARPGHRPRAHDGHESEGRGSLRLRAANPGEKALRLRRQVVPIPNPNGGALTPEHVQIRESVSDFAEREVLPIANELDNKAAEIPTHIVKKMAELGYFGLIFSPDYGGSGLDVLSMAVVAEELAKAWLSVGSVMTRMIITASLVQSAGTEEQKQKFLPGLCTGEILAAAAFTEPDAGSDSAGIKCRAVRQGDKYVVTGEKTWCTWANKAHLLCTTVVTDPQASKKHNRISILLIPKTPGDEFHPPQLAGSPIPTIGYKGMNSYSLQFDGYEVPAEKLLGAQRGKGFYQLMSTYEIARIQTAARAVGVAQAAFEAALRYSQERTQFGKPISEFQVIGHKLAHMATQVEAGRQLTYHAARMKDTGKRCDLEAGMAKAFCAEMAEHVTSEAMQVFGGYGYSREFPAPPFWRDARVFRIFEGTSEIQYEVIAKRLLEG